MTVLKGVESKYRDVSTLLETFGRYQVVQYILICLPSVFVTMIDINYVFVAGDIDYRCRIDNCDDLSPNSSELYPSWWPNSTIDHCSKPIFSPNVNQLCNESFTGELETCTKWVYENDNTVVAGLDLACQPWKVNLIGTIHNLGMVVSMIIAGWMSDRFGRKPTFIFCVVMGGIGQLKTLVTNYYAYITIEFFEATMTGGSYSPAMMILLEISGEKYRILSGVIYAYAIYLGECLFACIAMYVRYWKTLVYIIYGPCILFLISTIVIEESPRWLIVSSKVEKAKKSIKNIAKINKIEINLEELAEMDDAKMKDKFEINQNEIKESFGSIFMSKEIMKRLVVAGVARFTASFVYYGLMINSVWLPGDKYINFLLSTVMSFPGEIVALYLMNKVGRKLPLMLGFILCGVLSVGSACVPDSYRWLKMTFFLLGKVLIAVSFTGAITYAMELFPTSTRGTLLGLTSFMSRVGGLLAPLTPILNPISPSLPPLCFGCFAILSGALIWLTPETKHLPLFDTIKQVEASVKIKTKVPENCVTCSTETVTCA